MLIKRRNFLAVLAAFAVLPPKDAFAQSRNTGRSFKPSAAALRSSTVRSSVANRGHMARHVARDRNYLRARIQTGQSRRIFNAASKGADMRARGSGSIRSVSPKQLTPGAGRALRDLARYNARPKRASSFHNARNTDAMYRQALQAHRQKIRDWMRNPNGKSSISVGFSSNRPVGTVFTKDASGGRYAASRQGNFVLMKGGANGFFPATAKLY